MIHCDLSFSLSLTHSLTHSLSFCLSLSFSLSLSLFPSPPHPLISATYRKQRGTWIVKPSTLSRGRGISLINHVSLTVASRSPFSLYVCVYYYTCTIICSNISSHIHSLTNCLELVKWLYPSISKILSA